MLSRRLLTAFAFIGIISAAACSSSPTAPTDGDLPELCGGEPAPEAGMICRGDSWSWN